jgi:hypothetical protein
VSGKAPAQEAEELAVVLEENAEHFGDGDDVLVDRDFLEHFLLDPLGKENKQPSSDDTRGRNTFVYKRNKRLFLRAMLSTVGAYDNN